MVMTDENDVVYGSADEVTVAPPKRFEPKIEEDGDHDSLSLLDELAQIADKEIERKIKLEVDPTIRAGGWVLEFNAVIEAKEIQDYQRAATKNGKLKPENADNLKANALPLLQKNTGIFKGTKQVFDNDGDPVTLTSFEFLKLLGEKEGNPDSVRALKKFLGDAQIFTMGQALLRAAGYGDEMIPVDPTSD
jgi:hypothetical protein